MKLAILYIATGPYDAFWSEFHDSAERLLCPGHEKHYFVFTDSSGIPAADRVHLLPQDSLGWPFNTLYRFRMFLRISSQLQAFDRVVFFNANLQFVSEIACDELFPAGADLIGCIHPGYHDAPITSFTYEQRPGSTACIRAGRRYVAGGLMGGSPGHFLKMCSRLAHAIEQDINAGIMALWHDESHWNAFVATEESAGRLRFHFVDPGFLYPEGWQLPFVLRALLREKSRHLNVARIKSQGSSALLEAAPVGFARKLMARLRAAI